MAARTVLITAFEPSGDALAASLVTSLRKRDAEMRFVGFGGPKMQHAGVELLENTTEHAVMLTGAMSQVMVHRARLKRLAEHLRDHPVDALIPVDSAAANWSICKQVRSNCPSAKIIHLVLPQIWAWAGWRIHKLRRLTDHVMCILPFEPAWLEARGVRGTFVGHPLFGHLTDGPADAAPMSTAIDGPPRLAVLAGSRSSVIRANLPTMLDVVARLQSDHADLRTQIVSAGETASSLARDMLAQHAWPGETPSVVDQVDDALDTADVVLVNSGTATLNVAAHRKPMVVMYNVGRVQWCLLGWWLVRTRTFALPNVIAEAEGSGRIVPEFVPHFGDAAPVYDRVAALFEDGSARQEQVENLKRIGELFAGRAFGDCAADAVLDALP